MAGWFHHLFGLLFANAAGLGESMVPLGGIGTTIGEKLVEYGNLFLNSQGATTASNLFGMSISLRMQSPGTWLTLFALLVLVWSLLAKT